MGCRKLTYYDSKERALEKNLFFEKGALEKRYAEEKNRIDYYPFGMPMPGRKFSSNQYRYGFQGQEKDDEIKGEGNSLNYKYRMHDPRIGRFFAVDPLAAKFAWNSPYAFSENRVIDGVELEGAEVLLVGKSESAAFWASGSIEIGIMVAPDGIYGYTAFTGGVESSPSVFLGVSVTFFPTMPSSPHAFGWSGEGGISAGSGIQAFSFNAVYSDGYWGINGTYGVGLGGGVGARAGYTYQIPKDEAIKKFGNNKQIIAAITNAKMDIASEISVLTGNQNRLTTQINQLIEDKMNVLREYDNLTDDNVKSAYSNYINNINSKISELSKELEKNSKTYTIKSQIFNQLNDMLNIFKSKDNDENEEGN